MKRALVLMAHPEHGGIMRSLGALAAAAPRFGWQLECAFPDRAEQVAASGLAGGAVYLRGLNRWRRASGFARLPLLLWSLIRHVRRQEVDLLYCATLSTFPIAMLVARACGVGEIVHVYSSYGDAAPYRKYWLGRARHIVAPSHDSLQRAEAALGGFHGRAEVIYNGIDLDRIGAAARSAGGLAARVAPGGPSVGMVAYMDRRKNPMALVEVAARLTPRVPDLRVVLVGDFPDPGYRNAVLARARALGVDANIVLAGFQVNPFPLVAACDVIALPTQRDPFPIALLEAMALAKPVVATGVGGIPEMITSGESGFVVPPDDIDAFAGAVLRLLEDGALRERVGGAARQRLQSRFSLNQFVEQMFTAFDQARSGR